MTEISHDRKIEIFHFAAAHITKWQIIQLHEIKGEREAAVDTGKLKDELFLLKLPNFDHIMKFQCSVRLLALQTVRNVRPTRRI